MVVSDALHRPGLVLGGFTLLLCVALLGPVAGQHGAVEQPETDNTVTRIDVRPDGSARWSVRIRTRLRTEEEVAAYEAFQAEFRANRSRFLEGFSVPMRGIVAAAGNATDRPMTARDFTAETTIRSVPRRWGIVSYEFTWEGFARRDGERLLVGDAFESGFFIAGNDTLVISSPSGYEIAGVGPPADSTDDGTARWTGRVDFGEGQPSVTMAPAAAAGDGSDEGIGGFPLVAILVVVAIGLGAAALYARTSPGSAGAPPTGGAEASEPITDEQRVRRVLEEHGGRMRQADLVEAVDWSKSKVSRVLAALAEDGVVEKTRLGRENVVALADDGEDGTDRNG